MHTTGKHKQNISSFALTLFHLKCKPSHNQFSVTAFLVKKVICTYILSGDRGSTVVKVLRYKSEGRWFDPSQCHWNFSLT